MSDVFKEQLRSRYTTTYKAFLANMTQVALTWEAGWHLHTWPASPAYIWATWFPNQIWDSWDQHAGRGTVSENPCQSWEWAVGSHLGLSTSIIGSSKVSLNRLFWPYLNRERESPFQEGNSSQIDFDIPLYRPCMWCGKSFECFAHISGDHGAVGFFLYIKKTHTK